MKIKDLAMQIADEFNKIVVESDCETFKEMRNLFNWNADDIRGEIEYMIQKSDSGIVIWDDGEITNEREKDVDNYIKYGAFKKMIFSNVH